MDNIFQTDEVWVDRGLMERTNPGLNTGKMTLFMLASAGIPEAEKLVQKLDLTREETLNSDTVLADDKLVLGGTVALETRYRTMEHLAEESGCDTIVDLPCGYTPRAVHFAEKGIPYIGLDLPAAVLEGGPAIMSLIETDKKRYAAFRGADVTVGKGTLIIHPREAIEGVMKEMQFLADHGLKAERICISDHLPELRSTDHLSEEQTASIRRSLKDVAFWKITLAEDVKVPERKTPESRKFDVEASISGDRLNVKLIGRMDSMTSPKLLAFYEQTTMTHTIKEVIVDCSQLS